jgi:hypothetical protein
MCHERLSRRQERAEEARGTRLWDLFHRETEHNAPPVPMAKREDRDAEPEELLTAGARETNDSH